MTKPRKETEYLSTRGRGDEEIVVPLARVHGREESPTLLVVAGVHGSEYAGIEATRRLLGWVDPDALSGTLVAIPCLNLPAFYGLAMHVNPLDGLNLGDLFPGDAQGSHSERLAHLVFETLVRSADYVIDVHGGDLEEELAEYSQINLTGDEHVDEAAEALARALGMPIFLRSPKPPDLPSRGGLFEMASVHGVPGVLIEAGGHGDLDESAIAAHLGALRNALYHLGMLEGEPTPHDRPLELRRFLGVEAPVEGFWYPYLKKGDLVRKGQELGEMRDFFDERLALLKSEEEGAVLGVMTIPPRRKGDWVLGLGTLA